MKVSYFRKLGDIVGVMLNTLQVDFDAIGRDAGLKFIERK